MSTPDVSVVVAVYNTMPYLTECLTSLVNQSIGLHRLEIVAVNDGSTDGSEKELERFAEYYPEVFTVVHQANSGGPAAPHNRGLERATGRYVFFVGSDDYLGAEALERMVDMADRYDSDVVLGKMVGVNGREVARRIFAENRDRVTLFDSYLPWALSDTKLFRREFVERFGLRQPEHLRTGSDHCFTLEACLRAARISVLADYDCYFAVLRGDGGNNTVRTSINEFLRAREEAFEVLARFVEPGPDFDKISYRYFSQDISALLDANFLDLGRESQQQFVSRLRTMVDRYASSALLERLTIPRRLRLIFARNGDLDGLLQLIREDMGGDPPIVLDADRAYAGFSSFRDQRSSIPDRWFDMTDGIAVTVAKQMRIESVEWEPDARHPVAMLITVRSSRAELLPHGPVSVEMKVGEAVAEVVVEQARDDLGPIIRARLPLRPLLLMASPPWSRRVVNLKVSVFGETHRVPLPIARVSVGRIRLWQRLRPYRINPVRNRKGHLAVDVAPITLRRVVARLRRIWPSRGK